MWDVLWTNDSAVSLIDVLVSYCSIHIVVS